MWCIDSIILGTVILSINIGIKNSDKDRAYISRFQKKKNNDLQCLLKCEIGSV